MNSKATLIGLVAAVAVLSGGLGLSVTGAFSDLIIADYSPISTTGMLVGHLEVEARHADGEVFAYRQLDNEVVDDGEQCILKMLFATTNGGGSGADTSTALNGRGEYTSTGGLTDGVPATNADNSACTGALTAAWDVIAIGDCTTCPTAETNVALGSEITGDCMDRGLATGKTWTNGTGAGTTQIALSKTFTQSGGSANAVTESGLFNATANSSAAQRGNGMLARSTFASVTINDGDSITITWTFRVGD